MNGSATGKIEHSGDRDWFEVTLEAGKIYRIDLEGSFSGVGTLSDTYLRGVHDADGKLIRNTTDDDGGYIRNSLVYFAPNTSGTYYVAAGAHDRSNWTSETGTYRLSVTELEDDYSANTDTTGTVAVDGSATGTIETPGDRDWFEVTLEAGKTYRIDLTNGPPDPLGLLHPFQDHYLRGIYDADGNWIEGTANNDWGWSRNSRVFFEPETAGTYYIAAGANGGRTGPYRLSVTELDDDYSADTDTTGTIAVDGSAAGKSRLRMTRTGSKSHSKQGPDTGLTWRASARAAGH